MSVSSTHDTLPRLSTALRALVLAATDLPESTTFGSSEERADVAQWLDKASAPNITSAASIKALDAHLTSRTFLVSNVLTAADVALYGALHPTLSQEQPTQCYAHPALTRYIDHIQTRAPVRAAAEGLTPPLPLIAFDIEGARSLRHAAKPSKKKEKAAAVSKPQAAEARAAVEPGDSAAGRKQQQQQQREPREMATTGAKKEKKKDAGKDAKKGSGVATNESAVPVPSMIDLRVGHIVDVKKHPDADGLYVEQIDLGEETGPRTVVSGLVNYIPIEQMRNKRVVAVCNLKPATMRGVKSLAMVLCATAKEGKESGIEIIDPPPDAKPGDRVYFEGAYENDTPLEQLNPKKKIFETIQPGFITLETREAVWVDPASGRVHRIRTKTGVCTAPSLVGASLS